MEAESAMLEGFCEIPTIQKAWCLPSSIGGADIQVWCAPELVGSSLSTFGWSSLHSISPLGVITRPTLLFHRPHLPHPPCHPAHHLPFPQVLFGQRDLANNTVRRFVSTVHVPVSVIMGAAPTMIPALPWQLRPDVVMTCPSPSGCRMLVVRQSEANEKAPTVLEIWGGGRLLKETEVPRSVHRGVFNDGWFANGATWSPEEDRVCYVAEAPSTEKTPEWGGFTAGTRRAGEEADKGKAKVREDEEEGEESGEWWVVPESDTES